MYSLFFLYKGTLKPQFCCAIFFFKFFYKFQFTVYQVNAVNGLIKATHFLEFSGWLLMYDNKKRCPLSKIIPPVTLPTLLYIFHSYMPLYHFITI